MSQALTRPAAQRRRAVASRICRRSRDEASSRLASLTAARRSRAGIQVAVDARVADRLGGDLPEPAQQIHVRELARLAVEHHGQTDDPSLVDQRQLQHRSEAEAAVFGALGLRDPVVSLDVGDGERLRQLDRAARHDEVGQRVDRPRELTVSLPAVRAHQPAQHGPLDRVDIAARRLSGKTHRVWRPIPAPRSRSSEAPNSRLDSARRRSS